MSMRRPSVCKTPAKCFIFCIIFFVSLASSLYAQSPIKKALDAGAISKFGVRADIGGQCLVSLSVVATDTETWGDLDIIEAELASEQYNKFAPLKLSIERLSSAGRFESVAAKDIYIASLARHERFELAIPCPPTSGSFYVVALCGLKGAHVNCTEKQFAPMSDLSNYIIERAVNPLNKSSRAVEYRENSPSLKGEGTYFLSPFIIEGNKLLSFSENAADYNFKQFVEAGISLSGVRIDQQFASKSLLSEANRLIGSLPLLSSPRNELVISLPRYRPKAALKVR